MPDGFISHFYSVSEHVSPVLAFGFLGPKPQLSEVCAFFKVNRELGICSCLLGPASGEGSGRGACPFHWGPGPGWVHRKPREGRNRGQKELSWGPPQGVRSGEWLQVAWRTLAWREAGAPAQPDASRVPQHQIVQYLTDMFDLDNVRYTSVPALAEDILQLSRRRSEILLGYLGAPAASSIGLNGVLPRENRPPEALQ